MYTNFNNKSLLGLLFLIFIAMTNAVCAKEIPQQLEQWKDWVSYKQEYNNCPYFYNNQAKSSHVCAWPKKLKLTINNNQAQFQIRWEILQDSWVPLPGDKKSWPQNVVSNNKKQVVQRSNNHPRIYLEKGSYSITGQFKWEKRPESISIPVEIAGIDLSVDAKRINFPQRKGKSLWLGETRESKKTESNKTEIYVNRLIIDGHPMSMLVNMQVYVSGSARNEKLGKIGNELLQVNSIEGEISSYIDGDGYLWAQLKPGSWKIDMSFTVLNWPEKISFNPEGDFWPNQEVWAYQDDKNIRLTQIKGVSPINPEQSDTQWDEVPNYLINSGDVFEINETKRGTLNQNAQLDLNRTIWLGFDGEVYRSRDQISGQKLDTWRLNSVDGYKLLSAKNNDEDLLITLSEEDEQGIELRTPEINLEVNGEFGASIKNTINPWQTRFESIQSKLYLPYGYMPFAAVSVDKTHGVWLEKWKLWDIFIVMLLTVFCYKAMGVKSAVAALFTLVLGYHELNMPLIAWANVVLVIALMSVLNNGKLKSMAQSYSYISVITLLVVLTPFIINQVRLSMHPQLESRFNQSINWSAVKKSPPNAMKKKLPQLNKSYQQSYSNRVPQQEALDEKETLDRIVVTGSHIRNSDLINRYQTGSILQAGKGVPQWSTNRVSLQWDGPINTQQTYKLLVVPPILRVVWRLLLVFFSLYWLVLLLQRLKTTRAKPLNTATKTATAMVFLVIFVLLPQAHAQDYPSQAMLDELQQRVYQEYPCKNNCASLNKSEVLVDKYKLSMNLTIHAFENVIVALPFSKDWRVEEISIDGSIEKSKIHHKNIPWIKVGKGINHVKITGLIANRTSVSIQFPMKTGIISAQAKGWQIAGIDGTILNNNTLQLISTKQQSGSDEESKTTDIQPFVHVTRSITFDDDWYVNTLVERLAPTKGVINVAIPMIENESPTTEVKFDEQGKIIVNLDATQYEYNWLSRIDRTPEVALIAAENDYYLETWKILSSPQWNVEITGLSIVSSPNVLDELDDYFTHIYKPRPNENLNIKISRPKPLAGDIVSIESVDNRYTVGKRATKVKTSIHYRATQGGNFKILLDELADVNSVAYDGVESSLTTDKGVVEVGFLPGAHKVVVDWQMSQSLGLIAQTPSIQLENSMVNINQSINIPRSRWVFYGYSKGFGPAFLYWGEFIFFTILAFFLARLPLSILNFWQWLVLGYAFGTVSWFAFGVVTFWLFFVGWKSQNPNHAINLKNILMQWATVIITFIAISVFIGSVAFGLLSYPRMGIIGQGSSVNSLHWFLDAHQNQLPAITIVSLPIWWYKAIMLVWSIWVSFSLLNWLKKLIGSLDKDLWWKKTKSKPSIKKGENKKGST